MPGIKELIFGKGDRSKRRTLHTPEQQQHLKNYLSKGIETSPLYGSGSDFLSSLLSNEPGAFEAFEAPYKTQFQQEIAPGIAERFTGMGTGAGAQSSSALNNSLSAAGRQLTENLAYLRGGLQMQALPQALNYAQQPYSNTIAGLNVRPHENTYQPGNVGAFGEFLNAFARSTGKSFGGSGGLPGMGGSPQAGMPGGI